LLKTALLINMQWTSHLWRNDMSDHVSYDATRSPVQGYFSCYLKTVQD